MPPTPETMSQAAFARHIGRSPGRITQLKASGSLPADCFSKDSKSRDVVIVARALDALRMNLDPIQSVANGKPLPGDDLPFGDDEGPVSGAPLPRNTLTPRAVSSTDELTRQRIRESQLRIEVAEEKRRVSAGTYVMASDVGAIFAQTLEQVLSSIETGLGDLAASQAAAHQTEVKAELFALRDWWRGIRDRTAQQFEAMADRLPQLEADEVEDTATDGDHAAKSGALGVDDCGASPEAASAA